MNPKLSKISVTILGFLSLSNSIESVRKITEAFSEDLHYTAFINEWLALSALIPFGIGWLVLHLVELFIKHNKLGYAKVALWSVAVCEFALVLYILLFVHDEFLKKIGLTFLFLTASGSFLRYSTFEDDRYLLSVKIQSLKQVG